MAGGKVLPEPVVSNRPGLETSDDTDIFPACVVTRYMSKLASEEKSEDSDMDDGHEYDLEGTLFAELNKVDDDLLPSSRKETAIEKPVSEQKDM